MAGPDFLQHLFEPVGVDVNAWTNAVLDGLPEIAGIAGDSLGEYGKDKYRDWDRILRSEDFGALGEEYIDTMGGNLSDISNFVLDSAFPEGRGHQDIEGDVRAKNDLKRLGKYAADGAFLYGDVRLWQERKKITENWDKMVRGGKGALGKLARQALKTVPGVGALSTLLSSSPAGANSTIFPPGTSPEMMQIISDDRKREARNQPDIFRQYLRDYRRKQYEEDYLSRRYANPHAFRRRTAGALDTL
jgi:hypothetical protein|tara:strand:+ start:36 stop:773 length:738 start_codon:yes stop_codon:yes gene_type:complete